MAVFSEADRKRIEAKVAEVESRTAGEIVVASVSRSADYALRRCIAAGALGLLVASVAHHFWLSLDADMLLLLQLPCFMLAWLVTGVPAVLQRLVPREERQQAVEERAARMFTERGVFDTRDHSGVLLLVSELEHKVVMLGDRGIHARVETEGWERHVRHIAASVRAGKPADGVCEVLDELGTVLGEAFPRREDDENELPDQVIHEDR